MVGIDEFFDGFLHESGLWGYILLRKKLLFSIVVELFVLDGPNCGGSVSFGEPLRIVLGGCIYTYDLRRCSYVSFMNIM